MGGDLIRDLIVLQAIWWCSYSSLLARLFHCVRLQFQVHVIWCLIYLITRPEVRNLPRWQLTSEPVFTTSLLLLEASPLFLPDSPLFPEVSIPSRGLYSFLKPLLGSCGCPRDPAQEQRDQEDGYVRGLGHAKVGFSAILQRLLRS